MYKVSKNENSIEMSAAVKVISIPFDSWEIEDLKTEGFDSYVYSFRRSALYICGSLGNVIVVRLL